MSDYDRGPYTPPSDRLAFDRREPVRSGGPAPITLIVSGVILAAIIGGFVAIYHGGLKHKAGAPETVGQPAPAAEAAGAAAPAQLTIDRSDNSLAAVPAAPAAANAAPLAAVAGPAPAAPPSQAAPPPAAATPAAPAAASPAPIRTAAAQPAPPAATPAKPQKPPTIASLADAAVAGKPTPLRPALHADASAAVAPSGFWAQIGAFSTSALADKGWSEIVAFDRKDMAGKGKQIESTSRGGRTYYRTIVTGFASQAAAEAFCKKLTDARKPCIAH